MKFEAKWIWKKQKDRLPYNQTVVAKKRFKLGAFDSGMLRITADSYYRLYVNGTWIADGPCRSWTEHFRYDELDVTSALQEGDNEIEIVASFFGVGVLTRQVKEPGLLAQLDAIRDGVGSATVATDGTWEVAETKAWVSNTPKISLNMEAYEHYDARLADDLRFAPAQELYDADAGPWQDLQARDVALMTKTPFSLQAFRAASVVTAPGLRVCLPVARLGHPNIIEANARTSLFGGMATVMTLEKATCVEIDSQSHRGRRGFRVAVDGREEPSGRYQLGPGPHLVLALTDGGPDHHGKERMLRIVQPPAAEFALGNPLDTSHENPWCYIPFDHLRYAKDDLTDFISGHHENDPEIKQAIHTYRTEVDRLLSSLADVEAFRAELASRARCMPTDAMLCRDTHWRFPERQVVHADQPRVDAPEALIADDASCTTIHPSPHGDVELCYDLGEQNCGYYHFELTAEAGVEIDIAGIEHIFPDGRLHHTDYYKNSMRYVTCEGRNTFTSLKRRSGRYLFLTLRGFRKPVRIRHFSLIESTYPVAPIGSFSCSDERLDRIWEISTRTLKLCMEDTFTDCPLYEQTFWVGDARNEALFAFPVFGAADIAKRGIRLAAQMPDASPLVACQCPNDWFVHLPAWSFLWGISVWDYYWYSGDAAFVEQIFPAVIENIRGGEGLLNEDDLFSGPFWNMFDWSGADQDQDTVVHNTMFVVGAIDAALKCADVIGNQHHDTWLCELRKRLVDAVNRLWDDEKQAYPDSIHDDGSISESTCQHTSFLSILYNIVEEKNYAAALKNVLTPPPGMVDIGSPFAFLYLYETLEQVGRDDAILDSIYADYVPMIERGETTVTERLGEHQRSRCHAWSSSPCYFLNRIILGIRQTAAGGKAFDISPMVTNGITHAEGAVATPFGALLVKWEVVDGRLRVRIAAPAGVKASFRPNDTHAGLTPDVEITQRSLARSSCAAVQATARPHSELKKHLGLKEVK